MNTEKPETKPISRTRVVLSQVTACLAINLLLIDLGMAISFVTMILPEVLNAKEGLSMSAHEASWFGSMGFLFQPLGSLVSGPIMNYFGRRKSILLVNLPHLIAWLFLYYSWNIPSLFIANALLGIGTGIMEAPSVTYFGEVCDKSIRGSLTTLSNTFTSVGIFIVYLLGSILPWRVAALVSLTVPLTSMMLVLLVVESPIWLLSKGRNKDAMKSLCKIRGWAKPEDVEDEFKDLVKHCDEMQQCFMCVDDNIEKECQHNSLKHRLIKYKSVFFCKETLRPLLLVMSYFFFHALSGLAALRPNMVNICKALGMAADSKSVVIGVGVMMILMSITASLFIKTIGKRKLVLTSMLLTSLFTFGLSIYSSKYIPNTVFSFDPTTFSNDSSLVPLLLFMGLVSSTGLGIPWIMLSEVFPFKSRGIAAGFSAASCYFIFFIASKTNYSLEKNFHLSGTFGIYAIFGLLGTIYLYLFLPETENKSLLEIENMYKGKEKIFANDFFVNMFKNKTSNNDADVKDPMLVNNKQ